MYIITQNTSQKKMNFLLQLEIVISFCKNVNEFSVRWFLMKKERKLNIYDLGFKEVCTKILTLIFFITLCYS